MATPFIALHFHSAFWIQLIFQNEHIKHKIDKINSNINKVNYIIIDSDHIGIQGHTGFLVVFVPWHTSRSSVRYPEIIVLFGVENGSVSSPHYKVAVVK